MTYTTASLLFLSFDLWQVVLCVALFLLLPRRVASNSDQQRPDETND